MAVCSIYLFGLSWNFTSSKTLKIGWIIRRLFLPLRFILLTYSPKTVCPIEQGSRKEVFQPHLPVRLPCYDLAPVTCFTLTNPLRLSASGPPGSHGLTGGVYKVRERIHRAIADARLLAIPASWSRVAGSNPNCGALFVIGLPSPACNTL